MNLHLVCSLLLMSTLISACATSGSLPNTMSSSGDNNAASQNNATLPTDDVYRLAEGDGIAIQVFDEPDLTLQTVVGASGAINYSYLGDIRVAGKSPVELEQQITALLEDGYLVNPSVNVQVTQYRSFYINGEVSSPGKYQYQPGLTLERAIALAGGLSDRASTRKMFVTKTEGGVSREIRVSLDFRVHPGDTIIIKEGFF